MGLECKEGGGVGRSDVDERKEELVALYTTTIHVHTHAHHAQDEGKGVHKLLGKAGLAWVVSCASRFLDTSVEEASRRAIITKRHRLLIPMRKPPCTHSPRV